MPESQIHSCLVEGLIDWVAKEYLEGDCGGICHDIAGRPTSSSPPRIDRFVPDLFTQMGRDSVIVVGEAKTATDLDNRHSQCQFKAFLAFCNMFPNGVFALGVPWHAVPLAKSILHRLRKHNDWDNVTVVIPRFLPG